MNPTGFLAPSFAWLFLLVIPLVIVYFLKLKRPRLTIPSLVLWHSVINDQRVNSPFQRFKKHLLLWLQLAILLSLIFAAMQPFLRGGPGSADNLPILIDCSASMAATDTAGGPTRLERAKQRVEELIEGTLPPVQFLGDPSWSPGRSGASWQHVSSAGIGKPETLKGPSYQARHTLGILDLLAAIEASREPKCGMYEGRGVVEMIAACFESHRVGGPVALPLKTRTNPLTRF